MELAIETLFRIVVAIVIATLIIYLASFYYQRSKIKLPINSTESNLQIYDVYSEYELAKVIYGCYLQSNFGKVDHRIDCYIVKVHSYLNNQKVREILFKDYGLGDVYQKVDFSNLKGDVLLVYYDKGLVRFVVIK